MHLQLQQAREAIVDRSIPRQTAKILQPHATSLDADLQEAAQVRLYALLWTGNTVGAFCYQMLPYFLFSGLCLVAEIHMMCSDGKGLTILLGLQEAQEAMRAALNPAQLAQYSLVGRDADFYDKLGGRIPASGIVSMKADANDKNAAAAQLYKKGKDGQKNKADRNRQKSGGFKKRKM